MPAVPSYLLKKLYQPGSLQNHSTGFVLSLKNVLAPGTLMSPGTITATGTITALVEVTVDQQALPLEQVTILEGEKHLPANSISCQNPLPLPLQAYLRLFIQSQPLAPGRHSIVIKALTREVGILEIPIHDVV